MALAAIPNDFFSVITAGNHTSGILQAILGAGQPVGAHLDDPTDIDRQRSLWAAKLDHAILRAERPVLLVARGQSCFAATWWARLSPRDYIARVAGALFIDPLEADGAAAARFASPRIRLPFPSLLLNGDRPIAMPFAVPRRLLLNGAVRSIRHRAPRRFPAGKVRANS